MKESENKLTIEQKIEQWKAKYKNVYCYEIEDENGNLVKVYFRQPDRKVLSAATITAKGDPMKYNEIILKNCILEGDEELLKDDSIFYGLSQKVDELINAKAGELKKL